MLFPMKKVVLPNGLMVLFHKKNGPSVVVEGQIDVGSSSELPKERGITHFIEHMLFEGTSKRPTNQLLSNEIEKIGGSFNAYTTHERTCYHIKVLKKHFSKAIDVLADMLQNPLFEPESIRKEKNIVSKEIDLMIDEPKFYQWVLLQQGLFRKHPARYPTYGNKKVLRQLNSAKVKEFFQKHYVPNNTKVAVVGEVEGWENLIKQKFVSTPRKITKLPAVKESSAKKNRTIVRMRDVVNTYLVMGFKTMPFPHPDSYVLEVINGILGRGQSGKMFTELRGKRGLTYDVGTQHVAEVSFGFFAIYATIDKKNLEKVKSLILEELQRLEQVKEQEIKEAQDYIEGDYLLSLDDPQKIADQMLFWQQAGSVELMENYLRRIKQITAADVRRVAKKYFNKHTLVVLEGR